jgi:ACS family glucarate transporter-like MFS transporter
VSRASPKALQRPPLARPRVCWRIFLFLFVFGMVAYFQARSIPIASVQMMPQLGLSQLQIGWLETAFIVGYTALQFPGGVLGQRLGARAMFVVIGLIAFAATAATPLLPLVLSGAALFGALLGAQLLLGAAQGPIFPVSAGVFSAWFVPQKWSFVQGVQSMGLQLGAALAAPLIATLMAAFDWQRALLWTSLPVLGVILWWAHYARNTPGEHPRVSDLELAELGAGAQALAAERLTWQRLAALLSDRDLLLLTVSYVCMNYVFYLLANWCFVYLVQERHFDTIEGGWLAGTPPLAAAVGAGIGGHLAGRLAVRFGVRRGLRLVPLVTLPAAGLLQLLAVHATNAYLAVAALATCYFCVEMNEGPYWAAGMHIGRRDAMAATGILNTGGNLGGIIATPIVAYLSSQQAWTSVFLLGVAAAFVSAAGWLLVDPERRAAGDPVAAG